MEWSVIFQLIDPRLFMVVAACWVIGYVLKQTPKVPNWSIVYVVMVVSILLTTGLIGWSVENIIQGILAGRSPYSGIRPLNKRQRRLRPERSKNGCNGPRDHFGLNRTLPCSLRLPPVILRFMRS